jgi:hypothetical protein
MNGTISNSYSNGRVNGDIYIGGLVGRNSGTISNSYSSGSVNGDLHIGGLVGENYGTISNSYSSVNGLNGLSGVGGLVGLSNGTILTSFYDKETNTASMNDSSYGKTKAKLQSCENIIIIDKNSIDKYLDYTIEKYGKDFINLYEKVSE